eukprot:2329880-Amphidinium_carterae.3
MQSTIIGAVIVACQEQSMLSLSEERGMALKCYSLTVNMQDAAIVCVCVWLVLLLTLECSGSESQMHELYTSNSSWYTYQNQRSRDFKVRGVRGGDLSQPEVTRVQVRAHQRTLQDGRVVNFRSHSRGKAKGRVISISPVRVGKGKGNKEATKKADQIRISQCNQNRYQNGRSEVRRSFRCDQIGNQNVMQSKAFLCLAIGHGMHPGQSHKIRGDAFWFKGQSELDQSVQVMPPGTQAWVHLRRESGQSAQSLSRRSFRFTFNRQSESGWSKQSMPSRPVWIREKSGSGSVNVKEEILVQALVRIMAVNAVNVSITTTPVLGTLVKIIGQSAQSGLTQLLSAQLSQDQVRSKEVVRNMDSVIFTFMLFVRDISTNEDASLIAVLDQVVQKSLTELAVCGLFA